MSATDRAAPSRTSRTWPQRLTIAFVFLCAVACFAAAGALYAGQRIIEDRNIVEIDGQGGSLSGDTNMAIPADAPAAADDGEPVETAPPSTFPPAEPGAKNFLITGADNNSCIDPNSRYAPAFGDRTSLGERSDTIMMWRVNPATSQVAVLSFPRDLWVTIAGRSSKQRINVAYERDDPQRLIDTIFTNFGIPTDHFVQVDFCAFKTLVDAVGGVGVPFDTPVRDVKTGLDVPTTGCFTFDGDHALAYVRSRSLQYLTADRGWVEDGTSDLGRISRQQDFLRRVVSELLSEGAFNPDVAGGLIETSSEYVVVDSELTPGKMLEFAGVLRNVAPTAITTYQIEATPDVIQGNSVLVPRIGGDNMQAILAVFSGQATLAGAPVQVFESTTTTSSIAPPTTVEATASAATDAAEPQGFAGHGYGAPRSLDEPEAPETTVEPVPFTTLPVVEADPNTFGVVPDSSIVCP